MEEKNPYTGMFEVPRGYYVDIDGGPTMQFGHYKNSRNGECYVAVYKSLDKWHGGPPVEHVISVGNFVVMDTENMNIRDFLDRIRNGIEEVIKGERAHLHL